ncbi:uncharacterized protein B0H18DRAFT_982334 [Fomitopsis serialis]|uniref:uncharacterized protein n=1 Tax=Fomitopsis serialis TaxID=139415 RepID=UPI0020086FD7|nr:uncharacterized protein B0H18DRAFT_982334 [Neoantrodia serialis]KAH9933834.1 hypothetical protein B0H18DRAFT_982334 [Neoantrodia serialis]
MHVSLTRARGAEACMHVLRADSSEVPCTTHLSDQRIHHVASPSSSRVFSVEASILAKTRSNIHPLRNDRLGLDWTSRVTVLVVLL